MASDAKKNEKLFIEIEAFISQNQVIKQSSLYALSDM